MGTGTGSPPIAVDSGTSDFLARKENNRTTGDTPGRPAKKPVMAGDIISAAGAISRAKMLSASLLSWRTATFKTTSLTFRAWL
jgi:hypothetical protein